MNKNNYKIGYSDIGGIYISKNVQADFHKQHTITIILTFGEPFKIAIKNKTPESYMVAIVQKDVCHNFISSSKDFNIFIHLDPYSENGIYLTQKKNLIQKLNIKPFSEVLKEFQDWFRSSKSDEHCTELLLNKVSSITANKVPGLVKIDDRIIKSMQLIRQSDLDKLSIHQVADSVNVSPSHFAYLFKKETSLTFRKFVLHCKLIKSLQAIHKHNSLTDASYHGGFSDQPHFTRTFKNAFGFKPSLSRK